ncbi:NAD(P)-dependent alcohol dehydrogenase [Plantactinospora endophytica]|uniref:NADPH:quinone oxidoreductase n=1 Tax=Plantactinospora endophytica TaxID=673535 RepID=A0ABQ4E1V2_9ACTN|nr:NAD(P)-dependent alcohol dehydrogenase [Plantactinospora endophytica]GIG88690.1 NADPH:quinone oxidoreductase [Plantactinospora endophytica]
MRAAVYRTFGPAEVVRVEDVPTPTPDAEDVLIRVHAATVSVTDATARRGSPAFSRLFFGLRRPKWPVLGSEFAGVVEAVGPAVTRLRVGDEVVGVTGPDFGAHAEYVRVHQDAALAAKPADLDFAEVVALADGTALAFLRDKARLGAGQTILVNGASGSVGSAAVQLAKHFGARVTGVCGTANLDLVRSLGADTVLDHTTDDFTRAGQTYDVVFDAAGKSSFGRCRRVLNPDGIYLSTVPSAAILFQMPWTAAFGRRKAVIAFTGLRKPAEKGRDLALVTELATAGRIRPVIADRYPLERIAEAHRHLDRGKYGNIILTIPGPADPPAS